MHADRITDLSAEALVAGWTPLRVGRRVQVYPEVESTNTIAFDHAGAADADGLVVLADYQARGRGRHGRAWESPRGASVLCSVLLLIDEGDPADTRGTSTVGGWLTLASAVAACDAIRDATTITPSIKWPNDLRIGGRKLGGILIESRAAGTKNGTGSFLAEDPLGRFGKTNLSRFSLRAWVVGIGINCLQQRGHFHGEWGAGATSLELESSHAVSRVAVARSLLQCLDRHITRGMGIPKDIDRIHAEWSAYAEPLGQRVRLTSDGHTYSGTTVAVDPAGGLIVQTDDGRREWFDPMRTSLLP